MAKMLEKFLFHSPQAMKKMEERIGALKALRKFIARRSEGGYLRPDSFGAEANVWNVGEHVVKLPQPRYRKSVELNPAEMRQRAMRSQFLDAKEGIAAPEFMIDTSKRRYLVQPKADKMLGDEHRKISDIMDYETTLNDIWDKLERQGTGIHDIYGHNIGYFGGIPKITDTGSLVVAKPMTALDRVNLKMNMVQNKRRKEWLR